MTLRERIKRKQRLTISTTVFPIIGLLTSVSSHMLLQIAGCFKRFVALLVDTRIWFLSGVDSPMALQTVASSKSFVAIVKVALERTITGVRSHVNLHQTPCYITLHYYKNHCCYASSSSSSITNKT